MTSSCWRDSRHTLSAADSGTTCTAAPCQQSSVQHWPPVPQSARQFPRSCKRCSTSLLLLLPRETAWKSVPESLQPWQTENAKPVPHQRGSPGLPPPLKQHTAPPWHRATRKTGVKERAPRSSKAGINNWIPVTKGQIMLFQRSDGETKDLLLSL